MKLSLQSQSNSRNSWDILKAKGTRQDRMIESGNATLVVRNDAGAPATA